MVGTMHSKMLSHNRYTDFLRVLISILFLFACVSAIVWFVYVMQYAEDKKDVTHLHNSTIAFQAVVISLLLYATGHHGVTMIKRYVLRSIHNVIDNIEKNIENTRISL